MYELTGIGMQNSTTTRYPMHFHKFWEITYYYEGGGHNITNGKEYEFSDRTVICQPPYLEHEDISDLGYKNIYFCVDSFPLSGTSPIIVEDTPSRDFLNILRQLYAEYHARAGSGGKIVDALVNVLFQYLLEFTKPGSNAHYVTLFQRDIIENLSNTDYCIAEAMKRYPMCVDHFRRLFKKEFGVTPQRYLQDIRISYAKQLLSNSSLPLRSICHMCGYSDPFYFSRVFKAHVSDCPDAWRKRV